jgi:hypothetical protein
METTTMTVRGIAFDVVVTETTHRDGKGILFYVATVVIRSRKTGIETVARRSRIPGTGQNLVRDVQRLGVRALDAFAS